MKKIQQSFDVVVCGGGLAGFCAAIAAARHGSRTCLIQDRPVFGGNSSSEIRVTPHGAANFHAYARETGTISELLIEERAINHEKIRENGWTNSVWDMVMYDMAVRTPNLTFHLNTSVTSVQLTGDKISSVRAVIANAETELEIQGDVFIDCTGDGMVADMAGCEWRWGSEGKDEFGEPHAPLQASSNTMGNSIHFRAKDMGRPVPFKAPSWAVKHEDPDYFYKQGRTFYDTESGFWWIEIGIPWNTVYDNETIRHELTRHTLGIWDWMKNQDPVLKEQTANLALDWIGQVPGKRESRRILGRYFMTEHDIQNRTVFSDEIAYGGWFVDLHTPGGLLAETAEPASAEGYSETSEYAQKSYCGPYGIPFRIMLSKDVGNLMMAGRNVSVTHAALGTVRVMSTTALMGQAAGTGAAYAVKHQLGLDELTGSAMVNIQQSLLRDGCFLPNYKNEDNNDLARTATISVSSSALAYGVGPENRDFTNGFRSSQQQQLRKQLAEPLTHMRGQWIAINQGYIDSISVCLTNTSGRPQRIQASIVPVDHIWDYRVDTGEVYATTDLIVPVGTKQWVEWKVDWRHASAAHRYIRLQLEANPSVEWHSAGTVIPGHVSAFDMGAGRMRRYLSDGGTLSYRITPPQQSFDGDNIVSGVTRPYQYTNLWLSDPSDPVSPFVQLGWEKQQTIHEIQAVFPGHLFQEYHKYEPFYRDPQCPKDYIIEAFICDTWTTLVHVEDNYQRLVRHTLDHAIQTDRLRITILATNGDPSAGVYEVRCY
ncbi:FAD-dependent oxidoreductase [Paenibacillus roseipurpureus]|uniref:FAD-dependent oxidoreductase n=1 Tax=Paenibacillus roseopurpureus TaxID=2918901 RepID=A0AA96RM80_9BACL|nr:FAD-dependent oxidoreductase [Paenibacillus sp. MBLB1832]WNR46174.1 FAD-dependent oxidoreductase [Paenibacillus sp. MBLB1832]